MDSVPNVWIYFIDSQYFTVFLMFETIFLKIFLVSKEKSDNWVRDVVSHVNKISFGRSIQSPQFQPITDDTSESLKKSSPDAVIRQQFYRLLDRSLLAITAVVYAVMLKKLMPEAVTDYPSDFYTEFVY